MEEKNKQNKNNFPQIIIIILVVIIVTAIVAGGGVYLWMQGQDKEDQTPTQNQTTTDSSSKTEEEEPSSSPSEVAEEFILCTLGTVPNSKVDYEKAETYMSEELKTQFTEDSFIPQFYGIQQGPDGYEIKTQTINGDTASVKVDAIYGEMMQGWAFVLVKENGEWKIDEFHSDAQ